MDQRLSRDGHISRCHDLAQLCAGPRAVIGYGSLNGGDTSISLNSETPSCASRLALPIDSCAVVSRLKPPVVLRPDEM